MILQAVKFIWVKIMFDVISFFLCTKHYAALEYMEGGEVMWRDGDNKPVLSVSEARKIFRDVVSGLDYCKRLSG